MDIDTPSPSPPLPRQNESEPPPPDSNSESHPHSPATITATPSNTAGPSTDAHAHASTPISDRPKRVKDGYWKMKEAEAKAKVPAENDEPPQLSHTANTSATIENQQDILMTPHTTSSVPPLDITSNASTTPVPTAATQSGPKKRGRKRISPPPLMTTKGISLIFRVPPGGSGNGNGAGPSGSASASTPIPQQPIASGSGTRGDQESRDSTPDQGGASDSGSKKKRRADASLSNSRPTRGRPSPNGTPLTGSPGPSNLNPTPNDTGALSIFAPPPPSEQLPEALQTPLPADVVPDIVDADAIRKEAAAGFESRLRSRAAPGQRRDGGERTGVSASGKDVRVGGTPRTAEKANGSAAAAPSGTGGKKKGKGKADVEVPNQDFCSACRGIGRFLCCDGCPRSFHFMCLEPPLKIDELPDEETWYCKKCRAERLKESRETASPTKEKELKPIPMVFKQLSKKVDDENPCQFRLPSTLRTYFTGVGTAPRGEYVDSEEARTKFDRKGFQEDRDPFKTRDGKNKPIACYVCGGSSLPNHSLTTDPESAWRQIVSCDYCTLSWHLDCLDPPLSSMPNSGRKWMCPNHAEQALPRKRTVRNDLETIDIEQRHQPNNGNIVVIPEPERPKGPALDYEDLVINRKKFRVPERIIRLDFWEKVMKDGGILKPQSDRLSNPSDEDVEAANLVLSLLEPQPQSNGTIPEPDSPTTNTDQMEIDQPINDPFPTPSTPTHGKPQSTGSGSANGSGGKQPKIVLRMPVGLTPK